VKLNRQLTSQIRTDYKQAKSLIAGKVGGFFLPVLCMIQFPVFAENSILILDLSMAFLLPFFALVSEEFTHKLTSQSSLKAVFLILVQPSF